MSNQEYRLADTAGFDSLKLHKSSIPQPNPGEIQIKFRACSLNYRDLIISKGLYPLPMETNVVPTSDGAGEITAVGAGVTHLKIGDRVSPHSPQGYIGGQISEEAFSFALGGALDGCLRQYGNFQALSCVKIPTSLSYEEAATALKPGQTVLVQGTGGVSLFGAQFALAAGAKVILTSSSNKKIDAIKTHLGEKNVMTINYSEVSEWGKRAKELTDGRGVDHILEVGGANTLKQSIEAIAMNGSIHVIGFLGQGNGSDMTVSELIMNVLTKNAFIRGVLIGSVEQFKAMNAAIEANDIKPIIDKIFEFEDVKSAYEYQWSQQHVGKVVIQIPQ
ncbi:unnamed protein product [Adineta ricciae]|uniref:Enoyl reductase (ER) domain-containing protein n=1 Tax=Adineta ricciae TaxID=249248 RepID=A0A814QD39_ADIRI|nr:unnamed protein product [Adineta ricciae]CAF1503345.1 unnamed protein product [Adineta ricciae]